MYLRCDGSLTVSVEGYPVCDSWVYLTSQELSDEVVSQTDGTVLLQLYELLEQAFSTPAPADLAEVWFMGFSIPVLGYLVSSGYGVVINWFNSSSTKGNS